MRKVYYHKLIRDKIPEKMKAKGVAFAVRKLGRKKFEAELLQKVGEEASGLLPAKTKEELVSEMADVVDVLEEVKKLKNITQKQIEAVRKVNAKKKGGFEKRIFLVWSADDGYKTNERRYGKK